MEPSILKKALRKLRLTNEKLFPIAGFEIAERGIIFFFFFKAGVYLKGDIKRHRRDLKAELLDTETVTGKCKFKKKIKKKKTVINGRLCCSRLLNEKITVVLFYFLSQTTSLEIQTSDLLSLWLDSGLVQSERDVEGLATPPNE